MSGTMAWTFLTRLFSWASRRHGVSLGVSLGRLDPNAPDEERRIDHVTRAYMDQMIEVQARAEAILRERRMRQGVREP